MSLPSQVQTQMPHQQLNGNFESSGYATSTNQQPPPYPQYYNHSDAAGRGVGAATPAGPSQLPYSDYNGCKHNSSQYAMNSNQMHPPNGMYNMNMNYGSSTINTNGMYRLHCIFSVMCYFR